MTVGTDATSTLAVGTGDRSWSHPGGSSPKGVLVLIINEAGSDRVVGVTYGGAAMTEVTGSPLLHTTPETGSVYGYFLGSSISSGTQTVAVDLSVTTEDWIAAAITFTGATDLEIHDTTTVNSDGPDDPSATLTITKSSVVAGALYSGGAAVTDVTAGTGTLEFVEGDFGNDVGSITRGNGNKTTDFVYGWTTTASDDVALLVVAITEVSAGSAVDRTTTDSATYADTADRVVSFIRTAADSVANSDAATRIGQFLRTTADSVTNADVATRIGTFLRTTTDAVTQSDVATQLKTVVRTTADAVASSDAATRAVVLARSISDAVTQSDAATRVLTLFRTATDSRTQSDAVTQIKTILRTTADSVTQSDVATRVLTLARTATDSTTYSDAATRVLTLLRSVADASARSDAVTQTKTLFRTTADALTQSDAATRAVAAVRTVTDSTTYSDAAARVLASVRTAADSVTPSDVATRIGTFVRTAADSVTHSVVASAIKGGAVVVGDAVMSFVLRMTAALAFTARAIASLATNARQVATLTTTALEYDLSDTTRPTVTFTVDDVVTDPTTITLTVRSPDGTSTDYTYGAAQVTKSSTGVYYKDISLTQRGIWYFRFVGTGACEAAVEGTVTVRL